MCWDLSLFVTYSSSLSVSCSFSVSLCPVSVSLCLSVSLSLNPLTVFVLLQLGRLSRASEQRLHRSGGSDAKFPANPTNLSQPNIGHWWILIQKRRTRLAPTPDTLLPPPPGWETQGVARQGRCILCASNDTRYYRCVLSPRKARRVDGISKTVSALL